MRNYFTLLLVAIASTGFAQDNETDSVQAPLEKHREKRIKLIEEKENSMKVAYFFNFQIGSLIGCNDCGKGKDVTSSFATTHGVTIGKKFRTGLGAGFDSYVNWQTIPVYAVISWDLIGDQSKSALFVQLMYGWAHPWFVKNGQYNYYYGNDPFTGISGGRMIDPAIGYRLKYHDVMLSIVVGYKYQRLFYKSNTFYYCPTCDFPSGQNLEITEDLNRVQIMMSVGWK